MERSLKTGFAQISLAAPQKLSCPKIGWGGGGGGAAYAANRGESYKRAYETFLCWLKEVAKSRWAVILTQIEKLKKQFIRTQTQ